MTTAPDADPVALARLYRQRWPMQENILKDWLLPLGLEVRRCENHPCLIKTGREEYAELRLNLAAQV